LPETGESDNRSYIMTASARNPHWVMAVYVVVIDPKKRILVLRRRRAEKHFPGCWELPGGKPAKGETFYNTALVEVFEETGLCVELAGVAGAAEGSVPGLRVVMLILESRSRTTKITLCEEHDEFQWLPLAKVRSLKLRPGFDRFFASYTPSPQAMGKK
jgi:8-oxo-dGTP diphosphatase